MNNEENTNSPMGKIKQEATSRFENLAIWCIAMIIDGSFMAFWLFLQMLISRLIQLWALTSWLDELMFNVFSTLFAIATLIPVVLHTYKDIRILWHRTAQDISEKTQVEDADATTR